MYTHTLWRAIAVLLCATAALSDQSTVNVVTSKGEISGLRVDPNPATGASYDAFLGIPYGKVAARFQVAMQPDSWYPGTLPTQQDGPMCPQPGADYSENCLFLNVFTPVGASSKNPSPSLPVMVFIHGSAFTQSSSSSKIYGPDFLIPKGVILVTMNYRLGAAGFLTLGSKEVPGNFGLTDSLMALQWVQTEIQAFGGDPSSVTLFGQSAGSAMTQFHYLSAQSTGLFARAIAESGAATSDWSLLTLEEGTRRAKVLAEALGCNSSEPDPEILACLQKARIEDIVGNQSIALPDQEMISGSCGMRFVPVLDNFLSAEHPFFNDTLANLMAQALARGKPLVTGITREDGVVMFMLGDSWKLAEDNLEMLLPRSLYQISSASHRTSLQERIRERYFPDAVDENKVSDLVQLYTDTIFAYPSAQVSRYFANITYGYLFQYFGWTFEPIPNFPYNTNPVDHGAELHFLFYMADDPQPLDNCTLNWPNLQMRDNMVTWWTNFAKTGSPGPSWKPVSESGYMVIDSSTWIMNSTDFESRYYDFWANLRMSRGAGVPTTATVSTILIALLFRFFLW